MSTKFARLNAVEALIESAYINLCVPDLVLNADATTFIVYGKDMVNRVMIVKDDKVRRATIQYPSVIGLYN